ncbi:hypothetical protein [Lutibacter sp.]|uniref:lysine 5,6-aminomutase reactivase ATPase KamC n=1 Tax=Lutibacter sp. TaxID=1925666 RepID=UPI00349FEA8C
MNIKNTIQFIEFNDFYGEYSPLTPYGQLNKNKCEVIVNKEQLCTFHNSIGKVVNFINENSFASDKIENHLKKIAHLNSLDKKCFDSTDIFLVKKLLINFKIIVNLLNDVIKEDLNLEFHSQELLKHLSLEGEGKETFYLSSLYNNKLAEIRNQISEKNKALTEIKRNRFNEILEQHNLDFKFRDFIIIEENLSNNLNSELVYKEVYNKTSVLVKPILPKIYFVLHKDKELLLSKELKLEHEVLQTISKKIVSEKELIKDYIQKIEIIDTLFAKSRLAVKYNMTPPILTDNLIIKIVNGQFLPLANKCKKIETAYTPLNAEFDNKTIVITGSNMGGKTILLKTVGFMQILAQMGFWVPAEKFKTSVFENISYIGEGLSEKVEGLSSFGFEIYNLTETIKGFDKNSLVLIDEFAKTTNSTEAKAIISAMLKSFSQKETVCSFLSTHFMELPEFKKVSFYKMKGLNYLEYKKYYNKEKKYSLSERIKLINTFMQFKIIKTGNKNHTYDAIKIAETLGLNEEIITHTKKYLE